MLQTRSSIFSEFDSVRYEGPESQNALAYRWYQPDRMVLGKPLRDHLRFAIAYWHSFCWSGADPFGVATIDRPWMLDGDPMAAARTKADAAFDLLRVLDAPFFTFHDRDITPEGIDLNSGLRNLHAMADYLEKKMETSSAGLLWGTANTFAHRRFMSGTASNPDPDVFAFSAATVKHCMDVTKQLNGQNYVLWGGREGYETLLNTDLKRELDQLGRFLNLVVEYKHKIGFQGEILMEPKPKEPTKHQYDFDSATVYAFLQRYGLEKNVKLNIEANHATLAGHSFEHEIAMAATFGLLGSLDMNRGDLLLGWDTDQFPNDLQDVTLAMYEVVRAGGLGKGGLNFDAKIRRQSIDAEDLIHAHVGGIDLCARAFLNAAKLFEEKTLSSLLEKRYAGWNSTDAQAMLRGELTLEQIAAQAEAKNLNPEPRSGKQEMLENLVSRSLF
jgi:xylose isomerase